MKSDGHDKRPAGAESLSSRRAWIEIKPIIQIQQIKIVALLTEGVD